ncbi:MAG: DUF523 domain-containing protein [Bermanella sp.]
MEKILISACLLGEPVRYDGKSLKQQDAWLDRWKLENRLLAFCPEVAGGLSTPRDAAEIIVKDSAKEDGLSVDGSDVLNSRAQVKTQNGMDVSSEFIKGAQLALELCKKHNIQYALLSARSPSCGNEKIYDGSFNSRLIAGQGVTSALLSQNGIRVFNQFQLEALASFLSDA